MRRSQKKSRKPRSFTKNPTISEAEQQLAALLEAAAEIMAQTGSETDPDSQSGKRLTEFKLEKSILAYGDMPAVTLQSVDELA
ncbi:hypothetical protein NDU88_004907 [Pleurodeles waltl]|uniref:Uncharacterized protein n=1 Tax=Pleurodeles waltl TaxID=8319 RepID=A0AAV7NL62_PLEWA|nr:hypothetical protein NDU88_004907 [Pleurodeles waltl]